MPKVLWLLCVSLPITMPCQSTASQLYSIYKHFGTIQKLTRWQGGSVFACGVTASIKKITVLQRACTAVLNMLCNALSVHPHGNMHI